MITKISLSNCSLLRVLRIGYLGQKFKKIKKLFNLKTAFAVILLQYLAVSFAVYPAMAATSTYTYDANGNMTSDGTNCYIYNEANELSQVKNCSNNQLVAQYVYDGNGNRLIKKNYTNGVLSNTVYSPEDEYETKKLANGTTQNTTYYFANNEQIAKKNPDGTKEYSLNDQLGSNVTTTNQSGSVVENTSYDPWGNLLAGGTQTKFAYTGQEKDSETGLDYYNARYYNSTIRRFTQPDTFISDIYSPQDLNKYSYVQNNPIRYTDPTGHQFYPGGGIESEDATPALMYLMDHNYFKSQEYKDYFMVQMRIDYYTSKYSMKAISAALPILSALDIEASPIIDPSVTLGNNIMDQLEPPTTYEEFSSNKQSLKKVLYNAGIETANSYIVDKGVEKFIPIQKNSSLLHRTAQVGVQQTVESNVEQLEKNIISTIFSNPVAPVSTSQTKGPATYAPLNYTPSCLCSMR